MSQDSIGVVTTGRGKLREWKTTQKQNLSRKSRGTLTVVKWAGSRDKIFSPSGRGRTFFLTSLFIELIDQTRGQEALIEPNSGFLAILFSVAVSRSCISASTYCSASNKSLPRRAGFTVSVTRNVH